MQSAHKLTCVFLPVKSASHSVHVLFSIALQGHNILIILFVSILIISYFVFYHIFIFKTLEKISTNDKYNTMVVIQDGLK